jgi:hypothetical protein
MPPRNLSDETFDALKKSIEHVDFRARRLQDWRSLGQRMDTYKARFDVFMTILAAAQEAPIAAEIQSLETSWVDCASDLIELEILVGDFRAVAVDVSNNGSADQTVSNWIKGLVALGNKVDVSLKERSFKQLRENALKYKGEYTKINIQRNAKISSEVNDLTGLTNALRMKFE